MTDQRTTTGDGDGWFHVDNDKELEAKGIGPCSMFHRDEFTGLLLIQRMSDRQWFVTNDFVPSQVHGFDDLERVSGPFPTREAGQAAYLMLM